MNKISLIDILKEIYHTYYSATEWVDFIEDILSKYDDELWEDVEDYKWLYKISNKGRLKSLINKERVKHLCISRNGYIYSRICKQGKKKRAQIHRLVAQAFISNPNNYPIVNHKDENPKNNNVDNLEWCTYKYNSNYGTARERASKALKGRKLSKSQREQMSARRKGIFNTKSSRVVLQYDLDNNFIKEFPSVSQIQRDLGYSTSVISKVCYKKTVFAYGYKWIYKDDLRDIDLSLLLAKGDLPLPKKVLQIDIYSKSIIREFPSAAQVERELGFKKGRIKRVCRKKQPTAYGYFWIYKDDFNETTMKALNSVIPYLELRSILQVDKYTGKIIREFPSAAQVERELGFKCFSINSCCSNKHATAYGYKWIYKDDLEKTDLDALLSINPPRIPKSILQIDLGTCKVIREFSSSEQIEKELGFLHSSIHCCCIGKQESAYGYAWIYKDDLEKTDLETLLSNFWHYSKRVLQINKDTGEVIREFASAVEVERELGYKKSSIRHVCIGKRQSLHGYFWIYKGDTIGKDIKTLLPSYQRDTKHVLQLDKDTEEIIREFISVSLVKKEFGFDEGSIRKVCLGQQNTAYGYKWRYTQDYEENQNVRSEH